MDNLSKNEFRKYCINKIKFCAKISKYYKDKSIAKKILNIINKKKVKKVLLYLPLKSEVDLRDIIQYLRKHNIQVYVPFMNSKNTFKIVKYRLPLKKKKYNIYEPNNSKYALKIKLDLAIVPIVGFDISKRRIGFGVGFYDRFFSSLNYKPKIIFTQLCKCESKNIITNNYDIKSDIIIYK